MPVMKFFKLDLMSVLLIVVIIGVVVTMSSQAGDRSNDELVNVHALTQSAFTSLENRR